ncbi:MAG: tetratricopeptide repeat protein, partial [Akkermansiaceae bacterium]|nr:tetratricopeptide repeat protein [Akkermansiaceae bacterium]
MLEERVRELCYQEKWEEAVHAAETAVSKAREAGKVEADTVGELALSLEVKGDLLRRMGRHEEALADYREGLAILGEGEEFREQVA